VKILLTGGTGQVGWELRGHCAAGRNFDARP
jgi:dTDP-4-dehydrorhamnose reductase